MITPPRPNLTLVTQRIFDLFVDLGLTTGEALQVVATAQKRLEEAVADTPLAQLLEAYMREKRGREVDN